MVSYFFSDRRIRAVCAVLFTLGLTGGCVWCVLLDADAMSKTAQYIAVYFSSFAGDGGKKELTSFIAHYAALLGIMFLSGFFRTGIILCALCAAYKGFSIGLTAAAMLRVFGMRGIAASLAAMPEIIIFAPMLVFFGVMCMKMSFADTQDKKNLKKFYVFFAILFFSIFCVIAFLKMNFYTTFMSEFSGKLLKNLQK